MGVPFQQRAVHECAWVAFVSVTYNVLDVAVRSAAEFPLLSGGETATAPPTKPRTLYLVDNLIGTHLKQCLDEPRIAPFPDVVLDLRRINSIIHPEHDAHLMLVERDRFLGRDPPPCRLGSSARHLIEQPFDHLVAGDCIVDDFRDVIRADTAV